MTASLKHRPHRDPEHLARIRQMRCAFCGGPGGVPHHVRRWGKGWMGTKPPDYMAIPSCVACHSRVHTQGYGADDWKRAMEVLIPLLLEYFEAEKGF